MTATYEWLAAELVSGTVVASLPLRVDSFGATLNGAGSFRGSLRLAPVVAWWDDAATVTVDGEAVLVGGEVLTVGHSTADRTKERNRLLVDATSPGKRVVYAVRDQVVVGAYVIWSRTYDPSTATVTVEGAELWSLLRRRRITWQATYTGQDQLTIARDIITRAQAVGGGDLGIDVGSGTSGRNRDRTYVDWEAKPVAEAVEQLAAVIDGFDLVVTARFTGSTITRHLELGYPRRGRTAAQSGHVFEWGRNVTSMSWSEDASRMANSVIALGKGGDHDMVRTRVTDTTAFTEGYPLLEDSISHTDVSQVATLDGHARAVLAQRSRPVTLPAVTVLGDSDPPFGAYLVGDDCHLVVPSGVDPFWPAGLHDPRRIHAIEVRPPVDGEPETVQLVLGEATAGV